MTVSGKHIGVLDGDLGYACGCDIRILVMTDVRQLSGASSHSVEGVI